MAWTVALALLLSSCTGDDATLLQESDFATVVESRHQLDSRPPGRTWCSELRVGDGSIVAHSSLALSDDRRTFVGATQFLAEPDASAADLMEQIADGGAVWGVVRR